MADLDLAQAREDLEEAIASIAPAHSEFCGGDDCDCYETAERARVALDRLLSIAEAS